MEKTIKITIEEVIKNTQDEQKYPRKETVYEQTITSSTNEGIAVIIQNIIKAVNQLP